jgi:putative endonuclease
MADYYYVYIMGSQRKVIYVGVTSNLEQRVYQHKTHALAGFTARYNVNLLMYFERFATIHAAIAREKEIKAWRRQKKLALIGSLNPQWRDLSYGWYQRHSYAPESHVIPKRSTRGV